MEKVRKLSTAASKILDLTFVKNCAILQMKNGENRLNPDSISCLHEALDAVEESDAIALITTGTGKFYSNGLDLPWLIQQGESGMIKYLETFGKFLGRTLTFPTPTLAAINGHAFAGGCMFGFAHDYRVMREDRGWLCTNEIHLNMRIPPGISKMIRERIPAQKAASELLLFGKRFTGPEAFAAGMVNQLSTEENLINEGIDLVTEVTGGKAFDKDTLRTLKIDLYKDVYTNLTREYSVGDLAVLSGYKSPL